MATDAKEIKINDDLLAEEALEVARKEILREQNNINQAHRFDHTERVFNLCKEILRYHKEEADRKIVLIAAAFHDIGRTKPQGDHAVWSEELTKKIFDRNDFGLKKGNNSGLSVDQKNILKIILNHSQPNKMWGKELRECIEFKILVDADRIDSFGPIGIVRASLDERYQKSEKDQLNHIKEKYAVDNFELNTAGGQKVGQKYKDFLYSFAKEYHEQESIGI